MCDVDPPAIWQSEPEIDLVEPLAMVATRCFEYNTAGRNASTPLLEIRNVRRDRLTKPLDRRHPLKINLNWRLHGSSFAAICASYQCDKRQQTGLLCRRSCVTPPNTPLAQSAMAIGSSDQKVDVLLADDAKQFVRHIRCLQHEHSRRRDAITGEITHDIGHVMLDGIGIMLSASLHEEDLFGIMQERQ